MANTYRDSARVDEFARGCHRGLVLYAMSSLMIGKQITLLREVVYTPYVERKEATNFSDIEDPIVKLGVSVTFEHASSRFPQVVKFEVEAKPFFWEDEQDAPLWNIKVSSWVTNMGSLRGIRWHQSTAVKGSGQLASLVTVPLRILTALVHQLTARSRL